MKKRELTIPTILGILVTIGGLVAGVFLLNAPLRSLVGASPEETPTEVKVTNTADTSFVVSWTTAKSTSGYIQYGEGEKPELVVSDDRDQEKGEIGIYFTHLVTIRGLKAATNYGFRIGSGKGLYDQGGQLYKVTTGITLRNPPRADVAYGQIVTSSGDPVDGALVYLAMPGTVPQAAITKSSGSWVIPISTARTVDLTSFAAYDASAGQVGVLVQAGALGTATVTTTTGNTKPVPEITLGQTVNLAAQQPTPTPSTESKLSGPALVILTPKSGERVNSTQPEIMGKAPAGAEVTIVIHSTTQITQTVTADENGDWSYSVPAGLEPGTHTITITALVNGVKKTVQKSFVVEAAGVSNAPAKIATPAATLKPTPTPKPTPRVAYPSTESGTPQSGNLTPTLLLLILGSGLVLTGAFAYRKA
ncbi:MAG: fibronectin type III domain-containing protein [Patescibacteria group bacterium]